MDDKQKTMKFLEDVQYMTVAVTRKDGQPWAVPVHIQRREGMSFYWDSSKTSVHSKAIEADPTVMLMMYRLTDGAVQEFGFYAEAIAQIDETLPDGRARYRADITCAWINDETHTKRKLALE